MAKRPGYVAAIYRSIVVQIEKRRRELAIPLWRLSDMAGVPDGYAAKMIIPDQEHGRQADWRNLQDVVTALWPEGFTVLIVPAGHVLETDEDLRLALEELGPGKIKSMGGWRRRRTIGEAAAPMQAA